ncbi:hypothetical protein GCM10010182_34990 [Actinomadura cremea]|nr:hypothetical protein GCM10010182_34990 [Actinomadura cremea]
MTRPLFFAAVFMLAGAFMIYNGVRQAADTSTLDDRGRRTTGTVLDTREKLANGGKNISRQTDIQVAFTAADGTRHAFWARGEAAVGGTVDVHYDPENPETAIVGAPPDGRTPAGLGFAALGAVFLAAPPVVILVYGRRSPKGARAASPRSDTGP